MTIDEIFEVCESWNLRPSDSVKKQLRFLYCKNPQKPDVKFQDLVKV